jgi:hypothetical protein
MRAVDVSILDGGSVVVFTPLSPEARAWFARKLPSDCPRLGAGYAVERRYVFDILQGLRRRGFRLQEVV